jgi:hypothetical protein
MAAQSLSPHLRRDVDVITALCGDDPPHPLDALLVIRALQARLQEQMEDSFLTFENRAFARITEEPYHQAVADAQRFVKAVQR